ncbi:D-amino-acid transaminase [Bacillus canaveralius]|uniref:D-alanine aminotransferase n=1 Tax=Bacillus canaveralius TaxID=1403243 RepID=A0A2N5GGD9_9BACI|nr:MULTISPECIES: D-amino-acid transaminase [Bacillus]PLR79760.1 D-amino-acid transaminase [Bacillus canaveralius]PLR81753.1 D-amino-acid transaminase [Bacillus sp. V33-4]PLR93170.1 D-amino-acid transaminase [Bacillus canaveralius]RSK52691.1 D-amino-acid transaminase [Bacillus canaveralius]
MEIGYFNGKFISLEDAVIPIDERGHQFGDGVYEVIRVYNGKPFMMDEHLQRLIKSAEAIKLPLTDGIEELRSLINEGITKAGLADCSVYLQVTRGIAARLHLFPDVPVSISMTIRPAKALPIEMREKGANAIILEDERWSNCYIKSLNLLPNILAKQIASEADCFEAILVRDGVVTEGTSSNVFYVKDQNIYTAPLTRHILPGITRIVVKEISKALYIPFNEEHFAPGKLTQADEVFITSTTSEVLPIVKIDGQAIGTGEPGEITTRIYEQFQAKLIE